MQNIKKIFTYLVVGALVIALSISCKSNEDPGSGPLEVSEESGNSKDITINNLEVRTATVGFTVNGSTSYTISIENVSGSNPKLDASDFSYNNKELTLTSSGITKLNDANLTPATPYQYTITFKFVDSSDTSKEKTIDVKVNLYNAQVIGKTEIQDMIRSMNVVNVNTPTEGVDIRFSFMGANLINKIPNYPDNPDFMVNNSDISNTYNINISAVSDAMVKKLKETADYKKYFSDCNFNKEKKIVSDDKRRLSLYIKFTLKGGYALEKEFDFITSEGLIIQFDLAGLEQAWVE